MRTLRLVSILALGGAALTAATPAGAQSSRRPTLEVRPFVGGYVPFGPLRDALDETPIYGGQGALELSPSTAVVGAFALARPHDRLDPQRRRIRLAQVDVGIERARSHTVSDDWTLKPFLGVGAGTRSYTIASETGGGDERTRNHVAGYAALGTELQSGRLALRAEGRAYVATFSGLRAGSSRSARADASLSFGLAYHVR